ncbi:MULTISPECIES: flagellar filament capping protein FliD [Modicisalibacter]|uniref:Flagellar hook-associated protein 2 n=1 Tax=Modicisalibacter tunisiensis TaxID=390637 RepID=A0ABS7X0A3_9GAMM|nr:MULTISPECIES: flagellar filament capping protein FliD [Modicisalibacter]MBZ9568303.1 flagellar filament capping protein FliD [Modicisalibacter tunisiensis]
MASIASLGIGSGMDLNGLLKQLESAERQQLTPITQQKSSYKAEISAFGKLQSALESFQGAVDKLNDTKTFQAVSANVSGTGPEVTTDSSAVPGTYTIDVNNLAQAHSIASQRFADTTSNQASVATTITIDQPGISGASFDVSIDPASSSLGDIRDAINAADGGIAASVINDGSGNRLVLTSKDTGASSAMTVTVNGDATLDSKLSFNATDSDPDGMTQTVAAQDASLTVNNIAITSASNNVEGAIQGVTLDLTQASADATSASTLTVSRDTGTIKEDIQSYVDAYNSLQDTMNSLTAFNGGGKAAGELIGNSSVRGIDSGLRQVTSSIVGSGNISMLADMGIDLSVDGKLEVDDTKLTDALNNDMSGVTQFFGGDATTDGLADKLGARLDSILGSNGPIETATSGLENRISSLDDRYSRTEDRINATIDRYREQFSRMDSMVSSMNSTMNYLSQQLSSVGGQ